MIIRTLIKKLLIIILMILCGISDTQRLFHLSRQLSFCNLKINLQETQKRYSNLADILQCLHLDIVCETEKLPQSQLLVANLLIEYIGYDAFVRAVNIINPEYISCVIQINTDEEMWVSDSPYIHAFDGLDEIHHQMESDVLNEKMNSIGFKLILQDMTELPNSKALVRQDYQKMI